MLEGSVMTAGVQPGQWGQKLTSRKYGGRRCYKRPKDAHSLKLNQSSKAVEDCSGGSGGSRRVVSSQLQECGGSEQLKRVVRKTRMGGGRLYTAKMARKKAMEPVAESCGNCSDFPKEGSGGNTEKVARLYLCAADNGMRW